MQVVRRACSLLVVIASSCVGGPQARAPVAELPVRASPVHTLPNGLRLVVDEVGDTRSAGAVLIVGAGAADETAGQEGLAHLVEHLVFQARHGEGGDVYARLSRLSGGHFNGSTGWDATQFWAYAPGADMAELLGIFAAMLSDPLAGVTEEEFQREKRVVQAERRLRTENGTPGQSLGHLAITVFPAGHHYAHPVVGSESSLASLSLENARAFAESYYRPERATLALAGLGADAQHQRVAEALRVDPNAPPTPALQRPEPRKVTAPPEATAAIPSHEAMVPSSTLWIGWPAPPGYGTESAVPMLLADMITNAFHRDAGARDEGVSSVQAQFWPGVLASMFFLEVTLRHGSDPERIKELVIERMRTNFVWQTALFSRYRRWVQVRNTYAEEDWQTRLQLAALSTHFNDDPDLLSRRNRAIGALSEAQVDRACARRPDAAHAEWTLGRPSIACAHGAGQRGTVERLEPRGQLSARAARRPTQPKAHRRRRHPAHRMGREGHAGQRALLRGARSAWRELSHGSTGF
jgi:zinc protease